MALTFEALLAELNRLNGRKNDIQTSMAVLEDDIDSYKAVIADRETRHAEESVALETVVHEIERLLRRMQSGDVTIDTGPAARASSVIPATPVGAAASIRNSAQQGLTPATSRSNGTLNASNANDFSSTARWPIPNPALPTIIEVEGELIAIACGICEANASYGPPGQPPTKYFNGLRGLQAHVVRSHGMTGISMEGVLAQCHRTPLSDHDAYLVRSGQNPNITIERIAMQRPAEGGTGSDSDSDSDVVVVEHPNREHRGTDAASMCDNAVSKAASYTRWPSLHANYPTVIKMPGSEKAFAIACHICGANTKTNASPDGHKVFMAGLSGLQKHVFRAHPEVGKLGAQGLLQVCKRTAVDAFDVELITRGRAPLTPIEMIQRRRCSNGDQSDIESNYGPIEGEGDPFGSSRIDTSRHADDDAALLSAQEALDETTSVSQATETQSEKSIQHPPNGHQAGILASDGAAPARSHIPNATLRNAISDQIYSAATGWSPISARASTVVSEEGGLARAGEFESSVSNSARQQKQRKLSD